MRVRGVSLPSRFVALALSIALVLSCIPVNMYGQKEEAEALVPVAVGVGAAAATALGITEGELILGLMAVLGAGTAMQISFNNMYESLDAQTMEIDGNLYNYVDWRGLGVNVPNWPELPYETQSGYGQAWKYDEGVWLSWWMQFMGVSDPDPGHSNNNNNNKKWNLVKLLGSTAGATAASELGLYLLTNMGMLTDSDELGVLAFNECEANGKALPFMQFGGTFPSNMSAYGTELFDFSWPVACIQYLQNGSEVYLLRIAFYQDNQNYINNPDTFTVREQDDGWYFVGHRSNHTSVTTYNFATGEFKNETSSLLSGSGTYKLGHNYTYNGSNVTSHNYYVLNMNYAGSYDMVAQDVNVTPTYVNNYQYNQYVDTPQELARDIVKADGPNYQAFWNNLSSSDPDKVVTISNPYYQGIYNPTWQDYIGEKSNGDVQPLPDTTPDDTPFPDPEPSPDDGYGERLENIADLAFSQVFPFCLINDIKRLSDKIVLTASGEPDFSVTLPLSDFGIDGMESITLDANHADTGGGLLDIGDYTRPIFTVLFIALLLGFSIKLFLR